MRGSDERSLLILQSSVTWTSAGNLCYLLKNCSVTVLDLNVHSVHSHRVCTRYSQARLKESQECDDEKDRTLDPCPRRCCDSAETETDFDDFEKRVLAKVHSIKNAMSTLRVRSVPNFSGRVLLARPQTRFCNAAQEGHHKHCITASNCCGTCNCAALAVFQQSEDLPLKTWRTCTRDLRKGSSLHLRSDDLVSAFQFFQLRNTFLSRSSHLSVPILMILWRVR